MIKDHDVDGRMEGNGQMERDGRELELRTQLDHFFFGPVDAWVNLSSFVAATEAAIWREMINIHTNALEKYSHCKANALCDRSFSSIRRKCPTEEGQGRWTLLYVVSYFTASEGCCLIPLNKNRLSGWDNRREGVKKSCTVPARDLPMNDPHFTLKKQLWEFDAPWWLISPPYMHWMPRG